MDYPVLHLRLDARGLHLDLPDGKILRKGRDATRLARWGRDKAGADVRDPGCILFKTLAEQIAFNDSRAS